MDTEHRTLSTCFETSTTARERKSPRLTAWLAASWNARRPFFSYFHRNFCAEIRIVESFRHVLHGGITGGRINQHGWIGQCAEGHPVPGKNSFNVAAPQGGSLGEGEQNSALLA